MASTHDRYLDGVRETFHLFATWPINASIKLGDVGRLEDGRFERATSLAALGIPFKQRTSESRSSYDHSSGAKVSFQTHAGGAVLDEAKGSVIVELAGEGSFVFQAQGCVESSIEDRALLQREILALVFEQDPERPWDEAWVVVDTIYRAATTTVMISDSEDAKVEVEAGAAMTPGPLAVADAAFGASVGSTRGSVSRFVAAKGIVPLFKVSRLRRKYLGVFGRQELRVVKRGIGEEGEDADYALEQEPAEAGPGPRGG